MPSNDLGPISESYRELQGIESIESAFRNGLEDHNIDTLYLRTLLQCFELAQLNCFQLSIRQITSIKNDILSSAKHSIWHFSTLKISLQILQEIERYSIMEDASEYISFTPARKQYLEAHSELSASMIEVITGDISVYESCINIGNLTESKTLICQKLKNIYLINKTIDHVLSRTPSPIRNRQEIDLFLNSHYLFKAYSQPALDIRKDNFFTQFRLYHQIPELTALFALNEIRVLEQEKKTKPSRLLNFLRRLNFICSLTVDCLNPLLDYLLPRDYHKIRENLGQTSGSDSTSLSKKLFSSELENINRIVKFNLGENEVDETLKSIIERELHSFKLSISAWKSLHMGLPRNVLGGYGTRSLIGSEDAVKTVEAWKNSTDRKLGLSTVPSSLPNNVERLDSLLLKITSEHTQSKFYDVQYRRGPIFGVERKKP